MNRVMSIVIYFQRNGKETKKLQGLVHIGKTNASDNFDEHLNISK